jgi:multidrug efflux pump subunit AcrB
MRLPFVSNDVRRHRSISMSYLSLLPCHAGGRGFESRRCANQKDRDRLKLRLRERVQQGLAPEAGVRASQLVFGPYTPWPVEFRVSGPGLERDHAIAAQVQAAMLKNPHTRQVNQDWANARQLYILFSTKLV